MTNAKRRTQLYTKARKFGYTMQRWKRTGEVLLYFRHNNYDEECISDDIECLENFIRVAERNNKLERLGL